MTASGPTFVVHLHKQPYDVLVDRSTPFGNPFTHLDTPTRAKFRVATRSDAIRAFEDWAFYSDDLKAIWIREHVHELQGKTLGCWCAPKLTCHGTTLAVMAEHTAPGGVFVPPPRWDQITAF